MPLLLDAAYTLIHPAERVGEAYARDLEAISGISVDPAEMHSAFKKVFAAAPEPDYSLHPFGHAAERSWWRNLVAQVLDELGGEAKAFAQTRLTPHDQGSFEHFFDTLYSHFAKPDAWRLYPETIDFLEEASKLAPLAVVSNFDDRLTPILDGLGIGPFFEFVFTSADARARKPDRALFELALDRLNCAPQETFHCGDSFEADIQGARALGIRAFHLTRPERSLMDFLAYCRAGGAG